MQYLLLIYSNESNRPAPPKDPAAIADMMAPWLKYGADLTAAGVMQGGNALTPTSTATTVSIVKGEQVITDGPFAETKEQLGGYYLLDCKDLDEALKWAAQCPGAQYGKIEVRPIMDVGGN